MCSVHGMEGERMKERGKEEVERKEVKEGSEGQRDLEEERYEGWKNMMKEGSTLKRE